MLRKTINNGQVLTNEVLQEGFSVLAFRFEFTNQPNESEFSQLDTNTAKTSIRNILEKLSDSKFSIQKSGDFLIYDLNFYEIALLSTTSKLPLTIEESKDKTKTIITLFLSPANGLQLPLTNLDYLTYSVENNTGATLKMYTIQSPNTTGFYNKYIRKMVQKENDNTFENTTYTMAVITDITDIITDFLVKTGETIKTVSIPVSQDELDMLNDSNTNAQAVVNSFLVSNIANVYTIAMGNISTLKVKGTSQDQYIYFVEPTPFTKTTSK